ncbi:aminopeptidase P family protein [Bartonella sp. TP]|uniref:aminopeptidase P family protein n=1 Tax=Bartonella sp. TP TaxID=3057550 RepID=UPI0025AF8BD7|nr:aminopeptidase P family protein [Bartonella sp. TP]MDN5249125.1 aminopeptidase P family protein [Alphaproteobacteria bacterium]WJW79774.1 aminopeptidase P family protein [Bartonella sp. TP]
MFQSFSINSDASKSRERINALRALMQSKNIDAYFVPLCDEHQGEYIAPYAQRLQWLTGFTGSAGMALILKDAAIFFTDGRYQLQVRSQTDASLFTYEDFTIVSPIAWLKANGTGLKLAIDPWLHTIQQVQQLKQQLNEQNGELICIAENLVDAIWLEQPEKPHTAVKQHDVKYSGKPAQEKIKELQQTLIQSQKENLILTDTTSIAWLFNIRGNDVDHTPITLAFACVETQNKPSLFISSKKLQPHVTAYLSDICTLYDADNFIDYIKNKAASGALFSLDPQSCCEKIHETIIENGGKISFVSDPIKYAKALKNPTEIAGAKKAHIRDGVALTRFLCWLSKQEIEQITEIDAAKKLEELRIETAKKFGSELQDISFDTISGVGPHGAIIHYRVTDETNAKFTPNTLYLIDSGGQYLDGTTDVTRTIALGEVGDEEKRCFTLVLKGMIALTKACFTTNTTGAQLDILARYHLLQHGLDYAHGTGHGIGSYLSVHEGPQNISRLSHQPLLASMIISNEPGYYKAGAFGIRIENLLLIKNKEKNVNAEIETLTFETLTLCPIDKTLIDNKMLELSEIKWLNDYHEAVYAEIAPHLDIEEQEWLLAATKSL